jgi:putative flippase GtrA
MAATRVLNATREVLVAGQAKMAHFSRFTAVGAAGLVVNQGLYSLLATDSPERYIPAAVLATVGSTTFNFAGIESWVFRGRRQPGLRAMSRRFAVYGAVNTGALLLRLPVLFGLTSGLHVNYWLANLATLVALTLVRFALSDRLIWPGPPAIPVEAQ